jgi:hypothetical protein
VWKSECEESFGNLLCCKSLKLDNKLPFATDFAQRNSRLKVTVLSPFRQFHCDSKEITFCQNPLDFSLQKEPPTAQAELSAL